MPTDAVLSSSLSQTTAGTEGVAKPKVTLKQDELNKDINILVSLYRKQDLRQAFESDDKEALTRQANLTRLKKELKEVIQNATGQKKL